MDACPASAAVPQPWRDHPRLRGRFHPDHADDVQVLVHDGGPRLSVNPPELVWVRVTGVTGDTFTGRVLNRTVALETVAEGDEILFVAPAGGEYPLRVTQKYLRERPAWIIHACAQCGLSELFDAPSDLIRAQFPSQPEGTAVEAFTVICPLCAGVIALESKPQATR